MGGSKPSRAKINPGFGLPGGILDWRHYAIPKWLHYAIIIWAHYVITRWSHYAILNWLHITDQ